MTTTVYEAVNHNGDVLQTTDGEVADEWSEERGYRVTAFVATAGDTV